eukprot:Nitzschia sp. Nitz4//scaffold11_size288233//144615//145424//NITZ4_000773-RA/size288233-processed-gene-0.226-mRNA-1//-1//CDS//3329534071//8268//frame0
MDQDDNEEVADTNDDREEEEEEEPEAAAASSNEPVIPIAAVVSLDSLYGLREIGREALCWQLSSAKPGNGVEQIRDQSTDTYWQSDGGANQAHWIQVQFGRRVPISHVCIYLDYKLDESYTPKHISVHVGMTTQDLTPAIHPPNAVVELTEPHGWCIIPLSAPPDPLDPPEDDEEGAPVTQRLLRTHLIQISILSMHQNGRDTHIRQVQLYGPRTPSMVPASHQGSFAQAADAPVTGEYAAQVHADWKQRASFPEDFGTVALSQFSVLR